MKIIFNIFYYAFVLAIVALGLLLVGTLAPIPGKIAVKIVQSGSMEPTIQTGSIIVIRPVQSYAPGDVVTFGKDTQTQIPTTHRIVSIENGSIITKGDANDVADPNPTRLSEIKGKVLFSVPYLGYILDFARKPLGFALLVGIPASVIIIDELLKIAREVLIMQRRKQRKTAGPVRRRAQRREAEPFVRRVPVNGARRRPEGEESYTRHLTTKAICAALILCSFSSLAHLGGTLSYAVDAETSSGNSFTAGIVDIELDRVQEVGLRMAVAPGTDVGSSSFDLALAASEESLPLLYSMTAELDPTNPEGCSALVLTAFVGGQAYEGPLSAFSVDGITDPEIASFVIEIPDEDAVAYDAICKGNIVARAEIEGANEDFNHVFVDEERYAFAVQNVSAPAANPFAPEPTAPAAETPVVEGEVPAEPAVEPVTPPAEPEPEVTPEPAPEETPAA